MEEWWTVASRTIGRWSWSIECWTCPWIAWRGRETRSCHHLLRGVKILKHKRSLNECFKAVRQLAGLLEVAKLNIVDTSSIPPVPKVMVSVLSVLPPQKTLKLLNRPNKKNPTADWPQDDAGWAVQHSERVLIASPMLQQTCRTGEFYMVLIQGSWVSGLDRRRLDLDQVSTISSSHNVKVESTIAMHSAYIPNDCYVWLRERNLLATSSYMEHGKKAYLISISILKQRSWYSKSTDQTSLVY